MISYGLYKHNFKLKIKFFIFASIYRGINFMNIYLFIQPVYGGNACKMIVASIFNFHISSHTHFIVCYHCHFMNSHSHCVMFSINSQLCDCILFFCLELFLMMMISEQFNKINNKIFKYRFSIFFILNLLFFGIGEQ